MPKLTQIEIDGTTYDIGATLTAGTNVVITDDTISVPNVYSKTEIDAMLVDGDSALYGTVSGGE